MKLNDSSKKIIRDAVKKAMSRFKSETEMDVVTDIHLQPNQADAMLTIYDDDDNELAHARITEWATYESDDFDEEVQSLLTSLLAELKSQGAFDQLHIMKPYSFVLEDDDKENQGELFVADDETVIINPELMAGLDEDLDSFLKDLMKD